MDHGAQSILVCPHFPNALELSPGPEYRVKVGLPSNRSPKGFIFFLVRAEEVDVNAFAVFPEFEYDGRAATKIAL